VCYKKHCSRNQQNQGRRSFTSSPAGSAPLVQSWLWLLLRENLPPEHSHSVQGVAHTPPETLTARTGVALQQATPVSRQVPLFVPLFDSSHTYTHSRVLPHPSGSTPGFSKQSLCVPGESSKWCSGGNQLELVASGEGTQTKKSLGNYTPTI